MLNAIRQPIESEMARFEAVRQTVFQNSNPLLGEALAHVSGRRGKMMRPMLTFLVAKATGCDEDGRSDAVQHAAMALEMLHTASLVHDDVVDESDCRRGQASVNAVYDNQVAVLVGDYILSRALGEAAQTGSTRFVEALALLGQSLSDGELLQLHNLQHDNISEEQYYEVIRRKTASLFATCAAAGCVLGEKEDEDDAYRLGELIGLIFQMRDDLLDLDPESRTGKPAGNDMREGKLTLPVIHAVDTDPALMPAAIRVRRRQATDADIDALAAAARECGVPYTTRQMERMLDEAHRKVDALAKDGGGVAKALHAYVDYAANRDK